MTDKAPIDYVATYMIIDDYIAAPEFGVSAEDVRQTAIDTVYRHVDRRSLLLGLGAITRLIGRADDRAAVLAAYQQLLGPVAAERFAAACTSKSDLRIPLARQPILGAFRAALTRTDNGGGGLLPAELGAIMLSHAVSADFYNGPPSGDDRIGRLPARLAVDMVINHGFNTAEDVVSLLDRTLRLWRTYSDLGAQKIGRRPDDLLEELIGLPLEDLVSFAFAVWAHSKNWSLGDPPLLNLALHPDVDPTKWQRFLDLVAATPDQLAAEFVAPRSDWDFLAFQAHPVISFDDGLLLVDETFLLERVTSGLYWLVHDHLRDVSDIDRQNWTQAWGDMIEALAEDQLRAVAPPALGGGTNFYTEDDLEAAYGDGGGRADATLDFGSSFGSFEVVSGQLTVGSRIDGDPDAFRRDLEKLIFKKVRQLDGTATHLLADSSKLTGYVGPVRPVQPAVVLGGGLPVNPVTMTEARDYCTDNGLLQHAMALDVVLLDLSDLEMLEGLAERGQNPLELLTRWQASSLANLSLRNWLIAEFGPEPQQYRAARLGPRIQGLFDSMIERLGLRENEP